MEIVRLQYSRTRFLTQKRARKYSRKHFPCCNFLLFYFTLTAIYTLNQIFTLKGLFTRREGAPAYMATRANRATHGRANFSYFSLEKRIEAVTC